MSSAAVAAINASSTSELSSGAKQILIMQSRISDYFNGDEKYDTPTKTTQNCAFLRADIKVFCRVIARLTSHQENNAWSWKSSFSEFSLVQDSFLGKVYECRLQCDNGSCTNRTAQFC